MVQASGIVVVGRPKQVSTSRMATPANRSRCRSMAVFDAVVSAVMVYQYKSFETTCKIRKIIGILSRWKNNWKRVMVKRIYLLKKCIFVEERVVKMKYFELM